MAGMDGNPSYWNHYITIRFYIAVLMMGVGLICIVTEKAPSRYGPSVSRATNPKQFWIAVALYFAFGFIFLSLYFYAAHSSQISN
jgi:hypothetical protein